MKTKKKYLRLLRILGIDRCENKNRRMKRLKLKSDPDYIFNNRGVQSTYPTDWLNKISYTCVDGTTITFNPPANIQATDQALKELKAETIAGETLNKDIIDNSKIPK